MMMMIPCLSVVADYDGVGVSHNCFNFYTVLPTLNGSNGDSMDTNMQPLFNRNQQVLLLQSNQIAFLW
jgi:hypothetical protein